jgi:hypothetical protein
VRWLVVVLVAACKFTPHGTTDGAVGDDAMHDAAIDTGDAPPDGPPTCMDAWKSHTIVVDAPARIAELHTDSDDRDPFLTADEMTIYFSRDNGSVAFVDMDILVATRSSPTGTFGTPQLAGDGTTFDNGDQQGKIAMTADGLFAIYATDDATNNVGGFDLQVVTRASPTAAFANPTETGMASVDTNKDESDPWLSADGAHLYYTATQSSNQVIVMSASDGAGTYGAPAALPSGSTMINSGTGDADPTLSPDELVILFSSNRSGGGDIYYATRATTEDAFGPVDKVPTVNSPDQDGDPHLSADGCHVYFASNTNSGTIADYNIFVASAHPP